jgi:hypothetical protein
MNHIDIYTQSFTCINCGGKSSRSLIEWPGEPEEITGAEKFRAWAREHGYPLHEETEALEGLCSECYDGRSDEDIRLIRQLEVYSKNVRNIEDEGFKQDGAQEKHIRYQLLVRQGIMSWQEKVVFLPTCVPHQDTDFYVITHVSQQGLEDLLEV